MATEYDYTKISFPNQIVNGTALEREINESDIDTDLNPIADINVNIDPDPAKYCQIFFTDPLSAPDEALLDGVVAAHQGTDLIFTMKGTLGIRMDPYPVTGNAAWELIGCIITTPSFFVDDLNAALGRIIGEHKGDGGQLRLVEGVAGKADEEKIVPVFDFPDTTGAFDIFKVDTGIPPRAGVRNRYKLEARLNGATSLEVRYTTISLIEWKVVVG